MLWTLTLTFWYSKHYSWFVLFCFVFVLFFVFRISSLNVIYDWITIFNMGYSKHKLSTKNMLYLLKKNFVILHPYLPITASSPQRPLSSILMVAVVERFSFGSGRVWHLPRTQTSLFWTNSDQGLPAVSWKCASRCSTHLTRSRGVFFCRLYADHDWCHLLY